MGAYGNSLANFQLNSAYSIIPELYKLIKGETLNIHDLKTDPTPFNFMWLGYKNFEIRFDDRNFKVGDILHLKQTIHSAEDMKKGSPLKYTGKEMLAKVKLKITGYGLKEGWCVMSIKVLEQCGAFNKN